MKKLILTSIYLSREQRSALKREAKAKNLTVAALLRLIIDKHLGAKK